MSNGENPFERAAIEAAEKTNRELADELSGLTRLTNRQIQRLFPTRADKKRLTELLVIVNSATEENEKILRLKENLQELGGVVIKLVKTLA